MLAKIVDKEDILNNLKFYLSEMENGKIFIYPTDTIYGIGCSAVNSKSILKIRNIKKRDQNKAFSIIVPSKKWIYSNCEVYSAHKKYILYLPGPFTFILTLKNMNSISKLELIGNKNSVGIRIPDNWFSKVISKFNKAFVTSSVNISGEKHIRSIKQLSKEIISNVDYIIDEGSLYGKPSKIIDLTKEEAIILRE